jgi:hypothetical protein
MTYETICSVSNISTPHDKIRKNMAALEATGKMAGNLIFS